MHPPPWLKSPANLSFDVLFKPMDNMSGVEEPLMDLNFALDCYAPNMVVSSGVWMGDNPMTYAFPVLLTQIVVVSLLTRAIAALLRPFNQPRIVAESLAGLLLGPTVLGRLFNGYLSNNLFPRFSHNLFETVAHMGLLYFVFIAGLEMDFSLFRLTSRKVISVATAATVVPFIIVACTTYVLRRYFLEYLPYKAFYIYLGLSFSISSFTVLSRILVEVKLLNTEIGRIAISAAILNELFAGILLSVAIAISGSSTPGVASPPTHLVLLASFAFVLLFFFVIRPAVGWFMRRTPESEAMSDFDRGTVLIGVVVAGCMADAIGIHSVFGAFLYGLVIPTGPHGSALVERVEDFVTDLLLPLFFAISGFGIDLRDAVNFQQVIVLGIICLVGAVAKVGCTILIAVFLGFPLMESVSLGFLLNSRGFTQLVILSVARDAVVLQKHTYTVFFVLLLAMTATVKPAVMAAHKRSRKHIGYKRRNLQRSRPDSELRLLACVHTGRNAPSIINLLDLSNPTKKSPIFVYALHLVELAGRASAMVIVHNDRRNRLQASLPRTHAQSDHIISAFETYEQHAGGVSVQPLTAISSYSSMHEDVCFIAEERHAAIIILPFHKLQTVDGGMETTHPAIRTLNINILDQAPCSVGVFVDRGLSGAGSGSSRLPYVRQVTMLFFGGPDDREALAYAWRMAEHPTVGLTVVRFIAVSEGETVEQDAADEDYISEFRLKFASDESVVYVERKASNSEETVAAIRAMAAERNDLFVVGRGSARNRQLTLGLEEWSDFPELGPIGDLLASSDFGAVMSTSVLVVQQYVKESWGEVAVTSAAQPDSPSSASVQQYLSNHTARRAAGGAPAAGWHAAV